MDLSDNEQEKIIQRAIEAFLRERNLRSENLGIPDSGYFYHSTNET